MRVCDFIAKYLKQNGFDNVFGFQGGAITPLIDSLALEGIKYIQGYHEQASGFMADTAARLTNKCQIAMATNGPGATNLITAIANAHLDSAPTLFITGQVNTTDMKKKDERQNGFQEVDTVSMVKPVTKYAKTVKKTDDVLFELQKALYIAQNGRKGAVLLDFPLNVLMSEMSDKPLKEFKTPKKKETKQNFDKIVKLINSSKRPLILLGNGIRLSDATYDLKEFVKKTNIPVVTTLLGKDIYTDNTVGFSGLYGQVPANLALHNADLVLVLGARLAKRQFGNAQKNYAPKAKFIHIDIDFTELYRVIKSGVKVKCDLKSALQILNQSDVNVCPQQWLEQISVWKEKYKDDILVNGDVDPVRFIQNISRLADENYIITTDVGQNQMWCAQGWEIKNGQRFLSSGGLGCMGFSLPASIGAKLTNPEKSVIAFMGDGGFQMNLQELQTIKLYGLPVKIVIFNNNSLGMIQENQYKYMQSRYVGTKEGYSGPDLVKIAEAYGIQYFNQENIEDFMKSDKASMLEIRLDQSPTRLMLKYDKADVYEKENLL